MIYIDDTQRDGPLQIYRIIIGEPEGNAATAKCNIKRILKKEVMRCRLDSGCTFGFHKVRGSS